MSTTIETLRAQLETTAARIAELEAEGLDHAAAEGTQLEIEGNQLEIEDGLYTETSLQIVTSKPRSIADLALQFKTLVEQREPPNAGTDEDVAAVFFKNAHDFFESH